MTAIAHSLSSSSTSDAVLTTAKLAAALPSCISHGWSMVGSAPTNSTFAGVLAGFVFTSVTILIARPGSRNTQALGLLSCAFVVLGFDSYLFSAVAGAANDTDCARVWAEGIPSSGMLAVGGLAVVTGISWLLAAREAEYGQQPHDDDAGITWPTVRLDSVSRAMAHGVAFGVALLLASTVFDYGQFAFGRHAGYPLAVTALLSTGLVLTTSVSLTVYRRLRPRGHLSAIVPAVAFRLSSYGLLIYAVATTIFVGYITNLTASQPVVAVMAVLLGLIAPSILLIGLVQSVAPLTRPVHENPSTAPDAAPQAVAPSAPAPDQA